MKKLFAVSCLLFTLCVSALPMKRVIDPSMMRAPEVTATVTDGGGLDHGMPLTQPGLIFRIGAETPVFTAVVWVKNSSATYIQPSPFFAPERVTQRAVGTTFLGPVSGTGSQTWTATVPGAEAFPIAQAYVAYNLTCEAECTITVGTQSKVHAAGDTKGAMLKTEPGADITLTTEGAWSLEMAVPQYERCHQPISSTLGEMVYSPVYPGAQWCAVFCEAKIEGGTLTLTYRTYYPDGCAVVYNEETGETTVAYTDASWATEGFPKALLCAPFAVQNLNLTVGDSVTAYGLKAWPNILSEAERLFIVQRDREWMLRKGRLTEADVMHGEGGSTYSLRRDVPVKVHSPGEAPVWPVFEEE